MRSIGILTSGSDSNPVAMLVDFQGGRSASRRNNAAVLSCTMFKNVHRAMHPLLHQKLRQGACSGQGFVSGRLQFNIQRLQLAGDGERARKISGIEASSIKKYCLIPLGDHCPVTQERLNTTPRTSAALQICWRLRARMPSIQVILALHH